MPAPISVPHGPRSVPAAAPEAMPLAMPDMSVALGCPISLSIIVPAKLETESPSIFSSPEFASPFPSPEASS